MRRAVARSSKILRSGGASMAEQRRFMRMPWGEYEGKEMHDIPRCYLRHLRTQEAVRRDPKLWEAVCKPLDNTLTVGIARLCDDVEQGVLYTDYDISSKGEIEAIVSELQAGHKLNHISAGFLTAPCVKVLAPDMAELIRKYGQNLERLELVALESTAVQLFESVEGCKKLKHLKLNVPDSLPEKVVQEMARILCRLSPMKPGGTLEFVCEARVAAEVLKLCVTPFAMFEADSVIVRPTRPSTAGRVIDYFHSHEVNAALENILGGEPKVSPDDINPADMVFQRGGAYRGEWKATELGHRFNVHTLGLYMGIKAEDLR